MDLCSWIERHACFTPEAPAVRFEGREITYSGLAGRVALVTRVLRSLDVARGDPVTYLGLNHPDLLAMLFACARLRAMLVPLNWRLAAPEHARMLADCPPRALFVDPPFVAHIEQIRSGLGSTPLVGRGDVPRGWRTWDELEASVGSLRGDATPGPNEPVDPAGGPACSCEDDTVLLCYTSGSTGAPKGVMLTQRALTYNAVNSSHMHDLTSADRVLTTLPLFHVGGLNILTTPALHAGASVSLHPKFDPDAVFDAIERERITLTVLVPAQLTAMIGNPRWRGADLSSLRAITTGSTIVSEAFVRQVNARGVPLIQVYGATETCPIASYQRVHDAERKAGSAGLPALHCEIRVVDELGRDVARGQDGEILVRGPNVMTGYWRSPEQTDQAIEDGWYHSGDVGHFDADGHLHVVSRKKDMIISGGENIYPAELENILMECPDIAEACVVGRRDERWGEAVVAAVVPREGSALTREQVLALFDGRLARYKRPRDVCFLTELPRSALGKIRKDAVRAVLNG